MLHHAPLLREQGWRGLLPILPPDAAPEGRGKAPGLYLGNGRWTNLAWHSYSDDEATVEGWAAWPGVGIGMRGCYGGTDVAFIDADILDEEAAGEGQRLIRQRIGDPAPLRGGQAPKAAHPIRGAGPAAHPQTGDGLLGRG